jgi:hypothetical protein
MSDSDDTALPPEGEPISYPIDGDEPMSLEDAARDLAAARNKALNPTAERAKEATAETELPPEGDADPAEEPPIGEDEEADPEAEKLPPIERPKSWTETEDAEWRATPRALQEKIVARELERDTAIRRAQNEAAEKLKGLTAKEQQAEQVRQQYEAKLPALMQALHNTNNTAFSDIKSQDDADLLAMTLATSAFTTFSAIGNREDLSDEISRIDPTETPFYSGIERGKASATNHEWQTQALAAASTSNAQLEGDDGYAADATTATVRLGNICQISRKTPRVTGTQQSVDHAGRGSEMDYQVMLKGMELKRDIEAILTGANQAKVTGNSSTAPKLADVLSWIKTNTVKGGGTGADPTAADGTSLRVDSATQRAFVENDLKSALKKAYDQAAVRPRS